MHTTGRPHRAAACNADALRVTRARLARGHGDRLNELIRRGLVDGYTDEFDPDGDTFPAASDEEAADAFFLLGLDGGDPELDERPA